VSTAHFLLTEHASLTSAAITTVPATVPLRSNWRRALPLAATTAVIGIAITGAVAWRIWPSTPRPTITRFPIALGDGETFTNVGRQYLALSPDGMRLAYVANFQVYVRSMAEPLAKPMAGTESPQGGVTNPVFSPDGQSLAFYSVSERALKRIAVTGSAAVTICPADNPYGVSWDHDEILVGQGSAGILRVSATGGTPELIVGVKTGEVAYGPQLLPGGQAVLFTLATGTDAGAWDTAQIVVQSLTSGHRTTLVSGGSDARYLPTGHLVFARGGIVFAVRLDLRRLAVVGDPVAVIEGVSRARGLSGASQFSTAQNGTVVYLPGPVSTSRTPLDLAVMDRHGAVQPLNLPPAPYESPRVSPDGTRLAAGIDDGTEANVWVYELSGTSAPRQLTFGGRNRFPIWSPDGTRVTFQSDRDGDRGLFWQRADGAGQAERLTKPEPGTSHVPESWAPNGKTLLFTVAKGSSVSLWAFSMSNTRAAPYAGLEARGLISAAFSPDGRWVAYASVGVGVGLGVFVQPFPATGAKYQIAANAYFPFWSPDGHELFFNLSRGLAITSVGTTPTFTFSNPIVLLPRSIIVSLGSALERNLDIMPDGKRFVVVVPADHAPSGTASAPQIQVVEHWFEELKARVPIQ
jgi:Tol biopolymer transport system component